MVVHEAPPLVLIWAMAALVAVPVYVIVTTLEPDEQIVLVLKLWLTAVIPLPSTTTVTGLE